MSASATAYKFYALVMVVALLGAGYWLKSLDDAPWKQEGPPSNEPKKAEAPPVFARFPFERSGKRIVSATISRKDAGQTPVLWLTGAGVLVRKSDPLDSSLHYERTVIRKSVIEELLSRLLDAEKVEIGLVHLTFDGKEDTRIASLVDAKPLTRIVDEVLVDAQWKPAKLREVTLAAVPAQRVPESGGQSWPVRRLSLRRLVEAGEMASRDPDTNRLVQKHLALTGFYRLDETDYYVTARPVMP